MADDALSKALKTTHPLFAENDALWRYFSDHYAGGVLYPSKVNPLPRTDIPSAVGSGGVFAQGTSFSGTNRYLWQFPMEQTTKYRHRIARAVYINLVSPVVDFYAATVGKAENLLYTPDENFADFEENVDLQGQSYAQFMQCARTNAAVRGHTFILIDSTKATGAMVSQKDAIEQGIRPYAREICPEDMLNWRLDQCGCPIEILFRVRVEPEGGLLTGSEVNPADLWEYRYWTAKEWRVYTIDQKGIAALKDQGTHGVGAVPLVTLYHKRLQPFLGDSLLRDSAKIAQLVTNWVSGLDEAMECQMFAIPVWKSRKSPTEAGVGGAVIMHLNPEDGEEFSWVTPEVAPFEASWSAFYRMVAYANKLMGIAPKSITDGGKADDQSGISKEWDFVETEKVLSRMAVNEQEAGEMMFAFAGKWKSQEWKGALQYATRYDLATAQDDINDLISLQSAGLPATARQELMKRIVVKKMPSLPIDKLKKITDEIEAIGEYVDPAIELATATAEAKAAAAGPPQAKPIGKAVDRPGKQPLVATRGGKTPPAA
jgi:hypothetical protein